MISFCVLIPVYRNDKPEDFRAAVKSISETQTITPNEVLIIVDGPIPEPLRQTIVGLQKEISYMRILWQKENKGLGTALRIGVEHASHELIARMDSDDISMPDRFRLQLEMFEKDSELSIAGSDITEFIGTPDNIVARKALPTENGKIKNYMKSRCPFNHMTVMFKRSEVLKVGNYQDWFWNEDYYLWIRMTMAGCKFANISEPLVNVRVGKDMYARRGGMRYFKSEAGIQRYMYVHRLISLPRYIVNVTIRFIVQVLMPNNIRGFVFQKLFRSR